MATFADKLALAITANNTQALGALKELGAVAQKTAADMKTANAEAAASGEQAATQLIGNSAAMKTFAAAAVVTVFALKQFVGAGEAGQASAARLDTAIGNAGQSSEVWAGKIQKTTDQMAKLGFNNIEVNDSITRLIPATKSVGEALKQQGLAADIARGRNIDLASATDILVKIDQGRYTQLTRNGLLQSNQVKAFQDQKDAIAALSAVYGGQALAYSKTFQGQMDALSASTTNLKTQIGEQLLPTLGQFVGIASTAVGAMTQIERVTNHAGLNFSAFADAVEKTIPGVAQLAGVHDVLNAKQSQASEGAKAYAKDLQDVQDAQKRYTADLASGHTTTEQLTADSNALAAAQSKVAVIQGKADAAIKAGTDGTNSATTATQKLSAAQQQLQNDLSGQTGRGQLSVSAADAKLLTQSMLDAASAEYVYNQAVAAAQLTTDLATGSVISLADAYQLLGQSASQNAVQSIGNLNTAAFSQFDAIQGVSSAADNYNQSLTDLTKKEGSAGGATKTATAAFYDQVQKLNAVRDATNAVSDSQYALQKAQSNEQQTLNDAAKAMQDYRDTLNGVSASSPKGTDARNNVGIAKDAKTTALLDYNDAYRANQDAIKKYGKNSEEAQRTEVALHDARRNLIKATNDYNDAQRVLNGTLHGFAQGSPELVTATQNLQTAQDKAHDSLISVRDAANQAHDAQLNLGKAQADLQGKLDSLKTGGASGQLKTFQQKLDDVKTSAKNLVDSIGTEITNAGGSLGSALEAEIGTLKSIIDQQPALKGAFDSVLLAMNAELVRFTTANAGRKVAVSGHQSFAEGGWVKGPIGAPVDATVHGGEFVLSRKMLAAGGHGGGAVTMNVTINGAVSPEATVSALRQWVRQNGAREINMVLAR